MCQKIIFFSHSFYYGGAQKYLNDFVKFCCAEGIKCMVVGLRSGPLIEVFLRLGVDVVPIALRSIFGTGILWRERLVLRNILNTLQIISVILRFRPALPYTNTCSIISGALASKVLKVPHVWHIHENFATMKFSPFIKVSKLPKILEFLSRKIIFVSELALRSLFPGGCSKAVVIHNGVDISEFKPSDRPAAAKSKGRICFLGDLSERKGLDVFMHALAMLIHDEQRKVILDIWGEGSAQSFKI
jgi:glycosyltransferase involved in cell wall biosynthesis